MSVGPLAREARTLLGLPVRDALLVLVVAATIAFTIVAFAARTLGAPDSGGPPAEHASVDELDATPPSTLGGLPHEPAEPARHD